jgi:DNA gyrase/topoisomerase IV subunit A
MSLSASQRTNARTALLLEAVFDYAYEHVPRIQRHTLNRAKISEQESARISERLEEFLPLTSDREPIMKWLNDNMVSEAWSYPEDRRQFVRDCLRS